VGLKLILGQQRNQQTQCYYIKRKYSQWKVGFIFVSVLLRPLQYFVYLLVVLKYNVEYNDPNAYS
jgi:hypothetical protein